MDTAPESTFDQVSIGHRMRDVREAARVVTEGFSREYMRECIDNHRFPQEAWEALIRAAPKESFFVARSAPEEARQPRLARRACLLHSIYVGSTRVLSPLSRL